MGVGAKKSLSLELALTTLSGLAEEEEGMLGTEEVLSMALLAGVWKRGVDAATESPAPGLLMGVDRSTSEGLLPWAEIERRPPAAEDLGGGGASGARLLSKRGLGPVLGFASRLTLARM